MLSAMSPAIVPVVPPLPTCRPPPVTETELNVVSPVSVSVPAACLVSVPLPLMSPSVIASLRLTIRAPLLTMSLELETLPVVPPEPSCNVPVIVVVPVYVWLLSNTVVPAAFACSKLPAPLSTAP